MLAAPPNTQIAITESLGIRGWTHLDTVLLAALATESPLLLIGPHGTGKSQLIESVARALGLEFRHYNAALLNYDDIIGIPMPADDGKDLEFIQSPGTIWEAGFVFMDEISRCRADLQNKLFPIIHERRVVGIRLDKLQHRWAAMNPPAPEELDSSGHYYIGSEPLDLALTDRFRFVISVPKWSDLSREDQRALVSWRNGTGYETELNLPDLVQQTRDRIPQVEAVFEEWLGDYIVCLMDLLESNKLEQSPRRGEMLARSVAAIYAAQTVLEGTDFNGALDMEDEETVADVERSVETTVLYGMPQTATDAPPSPVKLVAIHKQAWELAQHLGDETWQQVIAENDPAKRIALADELGFDDENMSRLITQTLSAEDSDPRQIGLAVAIFLKLGKERDLDPSAFEPLAQLSYHILEPRIIKYTLQNGTPEANLWGEVIGWLNEQKDRTDSELFRLQRNYLLYGFPEFWRKYPWRDALTQFTADLDVFGINDAPEN